MKFYQELSNYYEEIFPKGEMQLELLREMIGKEPKRVIDIACGNGIYAIELAKIGHEVLGIDLSLGMIQRAYELAKEEKVNLELRACSMLEIDEVISQPYEVAFCMGNSLVHLRTIQEIQSFFNLVYGVLNTSGKFMIQIINYDRILNQQIEELPSISKPEKNLSFERKYKLNEKTKKIEFNTLLKVNEVNLENSVELIPLRKAQLVELLQNEGFKIKDIYGDFDKKPYNQEESFYCIVIAEK